MESIQTAKAALERRECPMREAMETALQDRTAAPAELTVTWEEVCRYLDSLAARGRRRETIQVYRPKLEAFYHFLPEDKRVAADTLELWRAALLREGYSPGTANTHVSAANGLLAYLGRRDLQLIGQLDTEEEIQPELSRTEYLRLLATARNLGRERTYLMVKVFALTGIRVSELNRVTVRAVEEGRVLTACDGRAQYVLIPACLRKELTVYLRRVATHAAPPKIAPATMEMKGTFAPQGMNVVVMIVIRRSRSFSMVREAMTPGTPQPTPTSIGMKDLPDRPNLRKIRSSTKAIRAM